MTTPIGVPVAVGQGGIPLRHLNAQFVRLVKTAGKTWERLEAQDFENAQGLWFQCPKCAAGKVLLPGDGPGLMAHVGAHYVLCWFRNRGVPADMDPLPGRWWPAGSSIDNLSFEHGEPHQAKSIQLQGGCNAHFFIENGHARVG